jgi:nucleotide-binding universal stress UspA family protein
MFDKILVPIDGSANSKKALESAVEVAKRCQSSKLTLIHVYSTDIEPLLTPTPIIPYASPESAAPPTPTVSYIDGLRQDIYNASEKILADAEKMVANEGVPVEKVLKKGHAVKEIIKEAKEDKIDLIVMGTRGLSQIQEITLGSVSEGVIRHAHCPVLVIR